MSTLQSITFKLLDKNKVLRNIEASITNRNGYPEFTISWDWSWSAWQVVDRISPANKAQKELLQFRKERHLNSMSAWTPKQMEILAKHPDVKSYDESVEVLKSYTINWKSLNYQERKEVTELEKIIIQAKDSKETYNNLLKSIPNKLENNNWRSYINEILYDFIKAQGLIPKKDMKQWRVYFSNLFERTQLRKKIVHILESLIANSEKIIQETMEELTNHCAYYVMHNWKVYTYWSGWIKKEIKDADKFRLDFMDIVRKASHQTDNDPLVKDKLDDEDILKAYNIKIIALAMMLELSVSELDLMSVDHNTVDYAGTKYLVGTDSEMDEKHLESIKNLVDDIWFEAFRDNTISVTQDVDGSITISKEVYITEDNRANELWRYDGTEHQVDLNGTTYYAYQQ